MKNNVWVCLEQNDGKIAGVSFEMLSEARKLADQLSGKVGAVLMGAGVKELAKEAVAYGADEVYVCDDEQLKNYRTDAYTRVLEDLVKGKEPGILLLPATTNGRDLAGRLASRLEAGLAADCVALRLEDGQLVATRPIFGGNLMANIMCPDNRPQLGTVRPGVFKKGDKTEGKAEIINIDFHVSEDQIRTKILEVIKEAADELVDLEGADIIVSGGRGVGGPEGFEPLKELADVLGATVGASRAAVDSGWISHSHQVGQTGKTVGPKLYIACGISGAIQHAAGIGGSDCIVAINKDPEANIFSIADYGIVGDLFEVVPAMTEEIKRLRAE